MSLSPSQSLQKVPQASEVVPLMRSVLGVLQEARDSILQSVTPSTATFANVVDPIAKAHNNTCGDLAMIYMLAYTSPDDETRKEVEAAKKLYINAEMGWMREGGTYTLLEAVRGKGESLDTESQKLLDDMIKDYTSSGYGVLDASQREEYLQRRQDIEDLRIEYNKNLQSDTSGLWFTLEELQGIPAEDLDNFKEGTEPPNQGRRFVRLVRADCGVVKKYAVNPETRKRMHIAFTTKNPENVGIFKKVVCLRDTNARLLGYQSHAEFRIQDRIAKSTEWIEGFLSDLSARFLPLGKQEVERLRARKKADLKSRGVYEPGESDEFYYWDWQYYSRIVEEEEYYVDKAKVSEYFPVETTVMSMLGLFASFLRLRFDLIPEKDRESSVWHEDVEVWSVWDERPGENGAFIGYLYSDVLWRENKYRGAQMVNIQCVSAIKGPFKPPKKSERSVSFHVTYLNRT
jgi:metallopeptidase MepB